MFRYYGLNELVGRNVVSVVYVISLGKMLTLLIFGCTMPKVICELATPEFGYLCNYDALAAGRVSGVSIKKLAVFWPLTPELRMSIIC